MQTRRLNFTADDRADRGAFEKYDSHGEKKTVNDVNDDDVDGEEREGERAFSARVVELARRTNAFVFRRRVVWLVIPTRQRRRCASSSYVVGRQTCQPDDG